MVIAPLKSMKRGSCTPDKNYKCCNVEYADGVALLSIVLLVPSPNDVCMNGLSLEILRDEIKLASLGFSPCNF